MSALSKINFNLPEWEYKRDFAIYDDVTKSLKQKNKKIGSQSQAFQNSSDLIFSKAKNGQLSEIPKLIQRSLDVRAMSTLWLDDDFFKLCPVSEELLLSLYKPSPHLSKLVVQQLLRLFFQRFNQIENLEALIKCLHRGLEHHAQKLSTSDIAKLTKNKKIIISKLGPDHIVKEAIKKKYDLDIFIEKLGLNSFVETRFYEICQNHYYLEQLQVIEPGVDDPLLQEIVKKSVYETPYKQTEMLGHEILRILIDRSPREGIDKQWQGILLKIAGDPRISKGSSKYQRWWAALSNQQIQKVRGWLSRVDLLLFLKVLEDYAENHGKSDMKRMFPARKKFLEGLFDMGLVEDSRLFLNYNAEDYLEGYLNENYKKSELPTYATVSSSQSMIYLKVAGKHLIEGTHSFRLWIFEDLPQTCKIFDYSKSNFTIFDLRNSIERDFLRAFKGTKKTYKAITHAPNSWQYTAMQVFSDFGVQIDPEKVLTKQNYLNYKRKYGISHTKEYTKNTSQQNNEEKEILQEGSKFKTPASAPATLINTEKSVEQDSKLSSIIDDFKLHQGLRRNTKTDQALEIQKYDQLDAPKEENKTKISKKQKQKDSLMKEPKAKDKGAVEQVLGWFSRMDKELGSDN